MAKHVTFYADFFQNLVGSRISLILSPCRGYTDPAAMVGRMAEALSNADVEIGPFRDNAYYKGLQFNIFVRMNGKP